MNTDTQTETASSRWFADSFTELHPLLQAIHRQGACLHGPVTISIGRGLAGWLGRRLATSMGIPVAAGEHGMRVEISHHSDGLHWDRTFDEKTCMRSVFVPIGDYINGYWCEQTGSLEIQLGVDIVDGGWHWRNKKVLFMGIAFPMFLFPVTTAHKRIQGSAYEFYVGLSFPIIGSLLSYSGLLELETKE